MGSSGDRDLSEDLLIDILSRLSVKSLLRCKCVCKYWYALIESPTLINEHFHHQNNHNRLLVHRCVCHHVNPFSSDIFVPPLKSVLALLPNEIPASDDGEGPPSLHQVIDYPLDYNYFDVIGPVNGLFMVLCYRRFDPIDDHVALWNPATKEFRVLPLPSFKHLPPNCVISGTNFGFGWDPATNNYKVVWIQFLMDRNRRGKTRSNNAVVAVYTLATDSWRRLDLASTGLASSVTGILFKRQFHVFTGRRICTYLNGAYYWMSHDSVDNRFKIVLFDMEREVFREIQPPLLLNPEKFSSDWENLELLVRNDSIALLLSEFSGKILVSIDIWLMEQEGCWNDHIVFWPLLQVHRPIAFWENGEALFFETRDRQLLLYNPNNNNNNDNDNNSHGVVVWNFGIETYDLKVFNYKESVVPIIRGRFSEAGKFSMLKLLAQIFSKICQYSFGF